LFGRGASGDRLFFSECARPQALGKIKETESFGSAKINPFMGRCGVSPLERGASKTASGLRPGERLFPYGEIKIKTTKAVQAEWSD